jgi:DnaJ-class molecular chaperone
MTYYSTLGVAANATPEDIKQAYRKLAKQHHPDLGGDAAKFQQISEAYETLGDADKRAQYDFSLKNPQPQFNNNGFDFHFNFGGGHPNDIFNDINNQFSQMFGFNFQHPQTPRNRNIRVQLDLDFVETLDVCQKTIEFKTSNSNERITLDLPAGIGDNTILQLAGRGDDAIMNVPRGTLEILIKLRPNPKFTKVDDHVLTEITINCFEAMLGMDYDITTPRGKEIKLSIPAGTQSGTQLSITDEGFTRSNRTRGKLIVKINVKIPTALTNEQLTLVKQIYQMRPINT